jgi:hypothetical protein
MFAACLVDRSRDCKLSVECVGSSVEECVAHLRRSHNNPSLEAEVLPGEERDPWHYVEIPGSNLYIQIAQVATASQAWPRPLPNRDDFADKYDWRHAVEIAWDADFRSLVRWYMPEYPPHLPEGEDGEFLLELLYMLQDRTSMFSPYIWSDDESDG